MPDPHADSDRRVGTPQARDTGRPGSRATDGRATRERGLGDADASSGEGQAEEAAARRADYLDAYRANLVAVVTDESLARDDIATILIRARGMAGAIAEGHGPRTSYAQAANLLTVYRHLLGRAAASPRDRDEALLYRDVFGRVLPWSAARPKRVEELPNFDARAIAVWNGIVADGPPPEYGSPSRRGRRQPVAVPAAGPARRRPGLHAHGTVRLPFGMHAVVNAGGPDARLIYTLIKTTEMTHRTPEGRLAILEAVVSQVLGKKHGEEFYAEAARELMKRRDYYMGAKSSGGVVYANEPDAFEKRPVGAEFTFEVGMGFLMNLDEVTGGAVPAKLIRELDPGVEMVKGQPKPLWRELYPRSTRKEKATWVWTRMSFAAARWEPGSGRPKPGTFYPGYGMFYVADGQFAGDQIWVTQDLRIFEVNEREALLEAFRVGVLQAAGAVALGYIMMSIALLLVEGPAVIGMVARLGKPIELVKDLALLIRTRPLVFLGNVAVDQGASIILSGGWENYWKNIGDANSLVEMLFTVLGAVGPRVDLPNGYRLQAPDGKVELVPIPGAAVVVHPGPQPATVTPARNATPATPVRGDGPATQATASPPPAARKTTDADRKTGDPQPARADDHRAASDDHKALDETATRERGTDADDLDVAPVVGGGRRRPERRRGIRGGDALARREKRGQGPAPLRGKSGRGKTRRPERRRGGGGGGGGGRKSPPDKVINMESGGVKYRLTVAPEAHARYEAIPDGHVVVYTIHDSTGRIIYAGITRKHAKRKPLKRLQEHLRDKPGEFVGEAKEFRVVGHYDPVEFPHAANALEHHYVSTLGDGAFNRDRNTWLTYADFLESRLQQIRRWSRGADDDLRRGLHLPRERMRPDHEGYVPDELDRPIRFHID